VQSIYKMLQAYGHTISKDWTNHKSTSPKESESDRELAEQYAKEDIQGVTEADVFILLTSETQGTGRYVELGAAIQSNLVSGRPQIYIINQKSKDPMFFYHPCVILKSSIEEVIEEIKKKSYNKV